MLVQSMAGVVAGMLEGVVTGVVAGLSAGVLTVMVAGMVAGLGRGLCGMGCGWSGVLVGCVSLRAIMFVQLEGQQVCTPGGPAGARTCRAIGGYSDQGFP